MEKKTSFVITDKDNVATILASGLREGAKIKVDVAAGVQEIMLKNDIPYGHKVAIKPIKTGEEVLKYGLAIGLASKDIEVGQHVHVHNIESTRGRGDLAKGR